MKEVNFKKKTVITLFSTSVSGVISVIFAYKGFGVWSLVFYAILNKLFNTIGLWINSKSIPIRDFSFDSLKSMFSYGAWLLFSSVFSRIFENVNVFVIGKIFPTSLLGFYTKAKQFQNMASGQIFNAFSVVAFPVFSLLKTEKVKLQEGIRRFLQQTLLVILPIISTLFVVANPFIIIFLTDKWEPMIPFLKLFCVIGAIVPVYSINILALVAQGHSKLNFRITFIINCFRIANVFIMYRFGVLYILSGEVLVTLIYLLINTYYSKKYLNYGLFKQLGDIKYHIIGAIIATIAGIVIVDLIDNIYLSLIFGSLITVGVFLLFQYVFCKEVFNIALSQKNRIIEKLKGETKI